MCQVFVERRARSAATLCELTPCGRRRDAMSADCDSLCLFVPRFRQIVVHTVKQGKPVERRGRKATGLSASRPTIAGLPL